MSPQEAFKIGFLLSCADRGLTPEATHALVKEGLAKQALGLGNVVGEMIEAPGRVLSAIGPTAINAGLLAGIGIPIAAGAGTGWAAAKLTDDDSNVDEAKTDEILAEYQRLTDQARRQTAMKQLTGQPTLGLKRPISAGMAA